MATSANGCSLLDEELKNLKEEIEHLNERLLTADREKAQAGALGLQLLNEKDQLETQLEIIQRESEVTKADLIKTKKVFLKKFVIKKILSNIFLNFRFWISLECKIVLLLQPN